VKTLTIMGNTPRAALSRRLGDLLIGEGLITREQLQRALADNGDRDKLGSVLIRLKLLTEEQLVGFLSKHTASPRSRSPSSTSIRRPHARALGDGQQVRGAPRQTNREHAHARDGDPTNVFALDDVEFLTALRVVPVVASQARSRRRSSAAITGRTRC